MYLIFSGYFAAEGLIYPFWPTWLASLGFGASQIGLLIAAAYWPQVIAGVALTYVADWRIDQLRLATLLAALAGACALLFQLAEGLPLFIALSVLYGTFWTSVLPLTESYLLKRDKAALHNYGRVRAVGSLAFILTATLGGLLLGRFGQQLVPLLVGLTMLLTALACLLLRRGVRRPDATAPSARRHPDLRAIFRQRPLLLAIGAAGMIQLSHSLYFTTASLGWLERGYSSFSVGAFWGLAVIAEISFFAISNRILDRHPALRVMLFSSLCAALRWSLLAGSEHLAAILLGQCLHALSFAAYHAAVMRYIRDHAPESARVLTQGIYYSLAVALPMGLASPAAGWLYERLPQWSYLIMAAFALGGGVLVWLALQSARDASTGIFSRPV
ncbi:MULTISPECIES: MFS transporter [Pseudomonas aeruginosa group]|uniref:MFS transporter n=1 Tax=Pseudomonas aeruginosa group TaxID=136841 RepID=UPI00071B5C5D|nr:MULTISPECIES: MFS transporter [Pseudomonas aeruginosa group]KSC37399.1 MFS transporter [Pseudomonas paraeruginosa]KSL13327.1 MFS transporter [Pseudomonas aeruginosa]MBH8714976.1 MFS transporter [Pseudomonas aeruginosa]MBI8116936.1 MFS transporter [Pseudomonas aeruginosa]OKR56479.1 MFS transporter [Pseudomonas aeruginosa]